MAALDGGMLPDTDAQQTVGSEPGAVRARARRLFESCLDSGDEAGEPWELRPGSSLGRYKLVSPLGEGGFGEVWRAEQEEPFHREVAIKVIKPGMDSREVLARFANERETLALMDHPNICMVLDAGTTAGGRPYVVMDLVEGKPLTTYCDQHRLGFTERLELFIEICRGVQHAHQKAILHRDLKPSNVLVQEIDGRGVPKIIDFGIAKALAPGPGIRPCPQEKITRVGCATGTPEYMSPEQAENSTEIDILSDVYSLGAILYELLAGTPPVVIPGSSSLPLHEVLRQVRASEVLRPSARFRGLKPASRTKVAEGRGYADPVRLQHELAGDLDWIVLKAVAKERARRYESASALVTDLERYLEGRPVRARAPSQLYVARKWIGRHRVAFVAAVLVLFTVVVGLVATTLSYLRERDALRQSRVAEKRASAEMENSRQLAEFLAGNFRDLNQRNSSTLTADALRDLLDSADARRKKEFPALPKLDASTSLILAQSYGELGQWEVAEALFRHALDCFTLLKLRATGEAAEAMYWAAWARLRRSEETGLPINEPGWEDLAQESLRLVTQLRPGDQDAALRGWMLLAGLSRVLGHYEHAAVLIVEATTGPIQSKVQTLGSFGLLQRERGLLSASLGDANHALETLAQARQNLLFAAHTVNQKRQVEADVWRIRRLIALQAGDLDAAEKAGNQELNERTLWLGHEDPAVLTSLADIYLQTDRDQIAEFTLKKAVEISRKFHLLGSEEIALEKLVENRARLARGGSRQQLTLAAELARVILLQGDSTREAGGDHEPFLLKAERLLESVDIPPAAAYPETAGVLAIRAHIAARRGAYADAALDLQKALLLDPGNCQYLFESSLFSVAGGDPAAFEASRPRLLEHLESESNPADLRWLCRALLLRSAADPAAVERVRRALEKCAPVGDESDYSVALLMGLTEYRAGAAGEPFTLQWLEEARRSRRPDIALQAQLVGAMFRARRNPEFAARELKTAEKTYAERFEPHAGTESLVPMEDFVSTLVLLQEAQGLMRTPAR